MTLTRSSLLQHIDVPDRSDPRRRELCWCWLGSSSALASARRDLMGALGKDPAAFYMVPARCHYLCCNPGHLTPLGPYDPRARALEEYIAGASLRALEEVWGISRGYIYTLLRRTGIPRRGWSAKYDITDKILERLKDPNVTVTQVAGELGVTRQTIHAKLRKAGVERKHIQLME